MAFDAGMLACAIHEISSQARGGRIEKIYQPEKDEIVIQMRTLSGGRKVVINAGSSYPRIGFSAIQKENPMQAPMFCMLLRKHLTGAMLSDIKQAGFERVAILSFDTRDEMGFSCKKYLVAEVMGKYSNLIFTDEDMKVISVLKPIDFTTSSLRQVLPGMKYELPPAQDKTDPLNEGLEHFSALYDAFPCERSADKFITSSYLGIAASNAREIVYRAAGSIDAPMYSVDVRSLWEQFSKFVEVIKNGNFEPCAVVDGEMPIEYSFISLTHYGKEMVLRPFCEVGELFDFYFETRDRERRIKQRASDILSMLTNAETRITKKLDAQRAELSECENALKYKKYGDLITSNMYLLKKGDGRVELCDYEDWNDETGEYGKVIIELDVRLTPVANAQKYYKKYNKAKNAKVELAKQIEIGQLELEYVYTVFDALSKAETSADLGEIRDELYRSGYASRMKGYSLPKKQPAPTVAQFMTTNGYKVYCGKNNTQNEYITHKLAQKTDWWFHAKGVAGSHVLLVCDGNEPPELDFTEACEIAAFYSKAYGTGSGGIAVDYLQAKGVKKISGAKPGFVVYHSNWSAYVTPNVEKIKSMRKK